MTPVHHPWHPISTAPRGERILVKTEHDIYAAEWVQNPETEDVAFMIGRDSSGDALIVRPTHWAHIPDYLKAEP